MQQTVKLQSVEAYKAPRFTVYQHRQIDKIEQLDKLPEHLRFEMKVVANVFPFRVNNFVIEELIDWDKVPNDPVFQLTFPQRGMLDDESYDEMAALLQREHTPEDVFNLATELRQKFNAHPAGQMEKNVPEYKSMLGKEKRSLSKTEMLNRDYYRGRFASKDNKGIIINNWEETNLNSLV